MDGEHLGRSPKKLTDAARYWVRGAESYEDAIEDLRRLNAPEEVIEELVAQQSGSDFEVFPDNWPVIEMFLRVQTQWRATYGSYYGLDYNSLFLMFDTYQVEDRRSMLEDIQIIERSVITALNEEK